MSYPLVNIIILNYGLRMVGKNILKIPKVSQKLFQKLKHQEGNKMEITEKGKYIIDTGQEWKERDSRLSRQDVITQWQNTFILRFPYKFIWDPDSFQAPLGLRNHPCDPKPPLLKSKTPTCH